MYNLAQVTLKLVWERNRTHQSRQNCRTRVIEIEKFNECSSDCTALPDCEEQVNIETPENTKN